MSSILSSDGTKTEAMNDMLAANWWAVALRGAIAILFGIVAFTTPLFTMLSLLFIFAAFSIIDGVIAILMSVRGARKGERWSLLVLSGILGIIAGTVAMLWPSITLLALVTLMAAWVLILGTSMLISAFRLKVGHGRVWLAICGIANIAFGILLVIWPSTGAVVLTWWIGAHALVLGVTLLILAFRLRANRTGLASHRAAASAT